MDVEDLRGEERTAEAFKLIGQGYLPTLAASAEGKVHDTSLYFAALVILAFVVLSLRKRAARRRYGFPLVPAYLEALRLAFVSALRHLPNVASRSPTIR